MKNISYSSLRVRLLLLVLAVIVPVLGLIVYHGIEGRNKDRFEALDLTRKLAQNASALLEDRITETHQTLFTLSQIPQFREQDPDACSKILADLLKQTKNFIGYAAVKPNGEVFASAPSMIKPISFADRPWFQRLVQTRSFVIGEYLVGRLSGIPTVILGYPVLDHTGRLMTVFAVGLDLEAQQQTLLKLVQPDGTNITVIDSDGKVLLRFPDPEKFAGKVMPESSIVKTVLTKKEGMEEGVGLDGVPRLFGYTTVGSDSEAIHIVVGIPEQVAYADIKRHMIRNFTLLGLVSILALLGAWLFGKVLIVSPVNRLVDVAKRVADGDLAVRTGQSDAPGELGLLAYNFDRMAESLHHREEERKLAEKTILANEEKYRLHFENVSDVIFSYDREFRFLSISPSLEQVFGYRPEEFIGKSFAELNILSPEDLEKALSDAARVFAGEAILSSVYGFIARDGTRKYGEVSSAPVLHNGQVVCVISVARDITERKELEDMLRITQFSVDGAAEPICRIDPDGRYLYANDSLYHLLNYSKDELLSMRIYDLDPDISAETWPEFWRNIKQQHVAVVESSRRAKDGTLIPVEIYSKYISYRDKEFLINFVRDIRERKLHEKQDKMQIDRLSALRAIDMAITASLDMRVTFSIFLEEVIKNLHVDAADVLVLNSQTFNKLTFIAARGFRTDALRYTNLSIGEGYAGRVAQERKTIFIPDLKKDQPDLLNLSPKLSSENFTTYCGTPLIAKGQVKGVLEVFNRTPIEPDRDWLDFLEALALQAAIAVDNAMLFDNLQKSNLDLIQAYDNTLEGWSNALDLRDKETEGHSQRVTEMTLRMARRMGMRDSELAHVRRGALLHDIGKMGIPDSILLKPGALNDDEWKVMRKHPEYAYELLYPISYLRPALDIPYSHHEKYDGTGYPRGLKGKHFPLAARIFAIVDVWDALRSDRPYRKALPEEDALELIKEQTGKHFDPEVVAVFLELLNELNRRDLLP
jgi:PAS domain S-box-containing protein/putative nucleotidyltransferase with HDIG domain